VVLPKNTKICGRPVCSRKKKVTTGTGVSHSYRKTQTKRQDFLVNCRRYPGEDPRHQTSHATFSASDQLTGLEGWGLLSKAPAEAFSNRPERPPTVRAQPHQPNRSHCSSSPEYGQSLHRGLTDGTGDQEETHTAQGQRRTDLTAFRWASWQRGPCPNL